MVERTAARGSRAVDTSPSLGDEVKYTTCYMCACRCGIKVHLKDGAIRYIEGNRDHPVNKGVLCAKGAAEQHAIIVRIEWAEPHGTLDMANGFGWSATVT